MTKDRHNISTQPQNQIKTGNIKAQAKSHNNGGDTHGGLGRTYTKQNTDRGDSE